MKGSFLVENKDEYVFNSDSDLDKSIKEESSHTLKQ